MDDSVKDRKPRISIPAEAAAYILFLSDRTCCVCRIAGKPVQIHHLDEDPSNNSSSNLSVLCLDCHNQTQLSGGFARKLDAPQIVLYRDDWFQIVAQKRAAKEASGADWAENNKYSLEWAVSLAEVYRENRQFLLLAIHYQVLGQTELRDKYIELALSEKPRDADVIFLRGLQGKAELIPKDVLKKRANTSL